MSTYSSIFMRNIRSISRHSYDLLQLSSATHSWIIALGLRKTKTVKKYGRSRAGCILFHHIYTWVNQVGHQATNLSTDQNRHQLTRTACNAINWLNLKTIDLLRSHNNPRSLWCALVSCRSAVNKTSEIKLEIVKSHLDLFALTKTWIRDDDTLTETQICPPGYKAVSIPIQAGQEVGLPLSTVIASKSKGIQPTPSRQWSVPTSTYHYKANLYT